MAGHCQWIPCGVILYLMTEKEAYKMKTKQKETTVGIMKHYKDWLSLSVKCNLEGEAVCIKAVKQDGYALRYVKEQSEAVCIEAVKQNGDALQYVKEQSEAVCMEGVKQHGEALQNVVEAMFEKKETGGV